ncbi:hypothetical protein ACQP2T_30620 [Nonomuraea sp. CA-143628]|uniref:hypothetical protein n=1 Tax=Nonomuraea sp. CA-143628 TaxID=3239997 RepID=UPI003D8C3177
MTKIALASHGDLGGVRKTGFYVPEAAHPWDGVPQERIHGRARQCPWRQAAAGRF